MEQYFKFRNPSDYSNVAHAKHGMTFVLGQDKLWVCSRFCLHRHREGLPYTMETTVIDELTEEIIANKENVPVIGASLIPLVLRAQGIEVVPSLQGGQIMPTMDRVSRVLDQVFFKTEQGLAFAVLGMAKVSQRPQVGIVTSGPRGLNTVTALADATRDCAPVGMIAGQVPQDAIGTDAFQGTDIIDVVAPVTKSARMIENIDQLLTSIPKDLAHAAGGRPGSVLWDLPKDVQFQPIELQDYRDKIESYETYLEKPPLDTEALDRAIDLLYTSNSPIIMAGYGLSLANVWDEFHALLELTKLPVVHTLPGKSAVLSSYQYNLGMLGMHGLYPASAAAYGSDFIFSLGARYDDRAVGNPQSFAPQAQERIALVHVDTEKTQFHKSRDLSSSKLNVLGDAGDVVRYLLDHVDPKRLKIDAWQKQVERWQKENPPPPNAHQQDECLDVIHVLESLNRVTAESHSDKIVVTDVGNHQMWSSQRIHTTGPRSFVTSAGIGTLGSGISQAIGAQLVAPDRLVVAIEGDEGYYSCGPELRTAARYHLPIKVLVINNGGQCIVRQWTTHMFGGNDVGVIDHIDGVSDMDFVANAASYGVAGEKVSLKSEIIPAMERMLATNGPYVLECMVPHEDCYPWIKPGSGFPEIISGKQ